MARNLRCCVGGLPSKFNEADKPSRGLVEVGEMLGPGAAVGVRVYSDVPLVLEAGAPTPTTEATWNLSALLSPYLMLWMLLGSDLVRRL